MKRRIFWLGLSLLCASTLGCKLLGEQPQSKSDELSERRASEKSDDTDQSESVAPKGFFKSTRLPGALSDEGREVENHLGIH